MNKERKTNLKEDIKNVARMFYFSRNSDPFVHKNINVFLYDNSLTTNIQVMCKLHHGLKYIMRAYSA